MFESLEPRQLLSVAPSATPIVRPDHIVVVIEQDRFNDAIGDVTHMPYTNQIASTGLVYSNSHGVGHPSEVNTVGEYAGNTFGIDDNGGNYTFPDTPNIASLLNSTEIAPGQFLSFSGFAESLPHDGDMTTVIANDPTDPTSPPDLYNRRYNPMAQFLNVGTRDGVPVSVADVNRTFASFPITDDGFSNLPTVSYVVANSVDNGHGSNEQDPYATDPAAYNIHRVNADNWLKNHIDGYLQWAKSHNSLLVVTTDEEETDTHPTSTITTIVNGDAKLFVPGVNSASVNHFNMLRTITDMYDLPPLGNTGAVGAYDTNALGQLAPQSAQSTSTTLISSNSSSVAGESVTFTATVTPGATGDVNFLDNAATIGTGTLDANGTATFTTSSLDIGSHSITATYVGDANFTGSTSSPVIQTVTNDTPVVVATTTTLSSSPNPSTVGQTITLAATIAAAGGQGIPAGMVTFMDGSNTLGSATLDANGRASLTTSNLAIGTHSIVAVYGGSSSFSASTSAALSHKVNALAAPTSVAASDGTSIDKIHVTWKASAFATSYDIYRNTVNDTETATKIGSTAALSFDDTTAPAGASYRYWIVATNAVGASAFSSSTTGYRKPANDAFGNAIVITGNSATLSGTNFGATRQSGEPKIAGNSGGKSVWWTWTATSSGTVTIDTLGSSFDTLLGVYTGGSVSKLSLVKSNNNASGVLQSKVSFTVTKGKTYRIAVDGYNGATGNIKLNLKLA